jgi:dTMP kinase
LRFPDRTTGIGEMLQRYLSGRTRVEDHAVHLLFSSNRWEKAAEIRAALADGMHVVVDRYAFSGVAFSASKDGLSFGWCKHADRGLPKPDLVCFLDISPSLASQRCGFGNEIYENMLFQTRVRGNYLRLMEEDDVNWRRISVDNKTVCEVYRELRDFVAEALAECKYASVEELWRE